MAIDRPPLTIGILLLVAVTYASSRECKFTCSGAPGNLVKLEPGKAYQYDLSGTTVTTKPGAKGEISKLGLNAKVEIVAGAGCENVITLSKVQTSGPDGKKYSLDKTIGSSPTKFGLQGGKLEELCVDESEHFASLNIKRAVVSLLQAALAKEGSAELTEVDVFGVCPTNLDASKSGSSLTVTKTRDLTRCSHREGINVPFTIPSYSSNSDIQTSHLLSGELKVTQKFDGGVLKLAESQEVYEYNPTSALEPQTKIVVNTKLALTGSSAKALPAAGKCTVAKPVIFDNEHEREFTGSASEITALLKKGCDSRSIDSEDARVFSSLVNAVSVAPKNEILTVYNQAKSGAGFKDKDLAVKQLLDAIYSSLSASSVEVIAELIKSKELSGADLFVWYLRLGAVKHASRASLTATLPLLDGSAPTAAYLGLGTLGARFCSEHKCHDVPEVEAFQKKLAEPLLKKGCLPKNHKDEDQLISSLKGVANMKYLTKDVAAKLGECFLNKAASTRIRSAVADTMKSDPHRSEVKDPAIAVFKDPREDSELRIKAYLVLVGCPCGKVAETVKAVLNSDQSRQVGSFVVSHLRNIRASTNPDKADAKHHLGGIISSKRYPIDTRKFSQNHELSYSLDLLNVGASAESNVIYSQQSWLPRFLSLNLTTQLYGHAINLIELDARLENVERVIESLVGPKGYANTNKPNDIVSKTKSYANNILDKIANRYEKVMRPKRSAASWSELNSIAEKVKLGINPGTDVNVDLTLKRLGAEIGWLKLHSADGKTNPDKVINEIFSKLDEAVSGAKDFDKDLRRHMTFINHDITYPTGLGLALRLKARGSAAVRVKVDGKMDLPAILKNPADTDFRLQLIPSAAIDVRGEMAIDGIAVETGVRVSLNVHSSTGTDLIVRVLEGRGVDVKVGLPVNKQEIISVKTDINTIIKEDGKPETLKPVSFDVKRESYDGCFDQVSEIIGLTFCGKVSVPWEGSRSLSPAYGPSELSLTIEKADESLSQYHFKIYQQIKEGSANFEVLYDTPGSKQDRKLSVALDAALKPKKYAKLNIYSPWTQAVVDGSIVENDHEFTALIKLNHDEAEYLLKAGAKKTKNGKQLKLEPIFEYKAPNAKSILIGRRPGSAKEQQQSFSASGVVLVDIEDQPYSRKWTIQGLSIITPKGTLVLDGKGSLTKDGIDGENKFTFGEDSVQINGHVLADGKTSSLKLAVSPSQYKDVSFAVLLSQTKEGDIGNKLNYENKLVITHGPDPNTKESKISFVNKFNRDAKQSSLSLGSQVTYPLFQVDGAVGLDIKPGYVSASVKAQADKYKGGLRVKAQTETDPKKSGNYNVEVAADAMSNSVSLVASRKVLKPTQSKFTNVLEITPGGKYELSATVTHNFGNDVDLQIDAEAKLPQEPKLLNIKTGLKTTKSECKGHFKASAGGKVYVDANGHCKKSDKPSGAYKLKLLGYIDTNGEFSYDGANLKANAKLDLPKSDRKANGKADLVMKDQKVSGFIDLCWDTKNPSKSLKIQTDSARLSGDNEGITSKNTITLDGSKTIVNGKYLITGKEIKSGKVPQKGSDSGEIEIILPSGYKFVGKGSDSWDLEGGQAESVYGLTLQEPGKGPRDMSLKIVGKNIDVDPIKFDTQVTLSYVAPDKRDAILHVSAKKVPKDSGKKWTVKGEVGSSGSLIEKPLTVKLESEVSDKLFDGDVADIIDDSVLPPLNYKLSVTLGSDLSLESNGKIAGTTIAGDLSAKLPEGSVVKSLKYSTTNIIDLTPGENKHNKLKTSQNLQWNEDKFIKAELEGICEDNGLRYSAEWETNALAKRKLTGAAHMSSKEGLKADATANLAWEGKTADLNAKWDSNKDGSVVGAHATAITPDHGKSDLAFKNKIIKEGKGWETDLSLASGDKKIVATSKIELDKEHPLVDINVDHPNGQSKLYFKNDKKGEKHWITEMKAKWSNNGGAIAVRNEADLGSIENLSIKSNLELPEHKKLDIDVNVKDGKKVSFSVKKDDKPYVSGNANYERKIEGKTKTVSGKGEVDIEGKSYPLSYVATYEELAEGDKFLFNLDAGSRKASVNILRTPEEFLWERTYCKEAGKCSKAFIKSKISKMSVEEFEQSSSAQIDFSVIDPKYHDVSYKYSYKRNGLVQDQNIELQWSDSEKIKYNAYVHENQAGVIVSLPKRTVGAELQYSGTKKGDKTGNLKLEADVWLNKEKNDKLCFIANVDVSRSNDNNVITGETKLTIPALKKDLIIKGKASVNDKLGKMESDLVVDIFRKPNQKIVLAFKSGRNSEGKSYTLHRTGSVKSEGCNLDIGYDSRWVVKTDVMQATWSETISYKDSTGAKREATASFEGSPKKIVAKVKAPEGVLGELDVNIDSQQKEMNYLINVGIAGLKYKESLKYNLDNNHLVNTMVLDGKTIEIEAGAKVGKDGIVKLTIDGKAAAELNVQLDEANFLKSKYNYDIETLKSVWHCVADASTKALKTLEKRFIDVIGKQRAEVVKILECLGEGVPDLTAAGEHIKGQLKQIREELISEESLNELVKTLKQSLGKVAGQVADVLEEIVKFAQTIASLVQEAIKKGGAIAKEVSPKIQESIKRITNMVVEVAEEIVQLSIKISDAVLDIIKKHEADIQEYVKAVTDFIHEFGKQFSKLAFAIQDELKKFVDGATEQLKELPIVEMIKEKINEIKQLDIPEEALNAYEELVGGLKAIMPTPECEAFLDALNVYIRKLLKKENINAEEASKELATKGEAAIRSIAKKVAELIPKQSGWKASKLWSLPLTRWMRLPTGGLRISVINWILSRDVPTVYEVLSALSPSLLNPLDNIPPFKGIGAVIGGSQIITFDGRHLDTSGSCSYVLAQDYLDGNFSVSAKWSGTWYLDSITISNAKESISIVRNGKPLVNGKATDYPVQLEELSAWYRPNGVLAKSKAGVRITCDHLLAACQVEVSGFYFNRVRGLLGNLNYEQYDDLLLPNGEVAADPSALTTAWKTSPGCAASAAPHPESRQQECTELFGKDPEILIGKPWADTEPWRSVCDHSVNSAPADMKQIVACEVAKSYVFFARTKGAFFLTLPTECVKCKLGDKDLELWSSEDVDVGKAADIVLVLESTQDNKETFENLVNPLLAALKPELDKKGCSDVQVSVLTFSPSSRWPEWHTSNGKPIYDGKDINIQWTERPIDKNVTTEDKVALAISTAHRNSGTTSLASAYEDVALNFDFRPHAAKAVIGVHGKPCYSPLNLLVPAKAFLATLLAELKGASYNLITPVEDIELEGVQADNIIAFDDKSATTLDGKKHEGDVDYANDYCVLSADVSGIVVPSNNWKKAQAAGKGGDFIRLTAERLAKTIIKESNEEVDCHCALVNGLHPKVRCYALSGDD